jgi:hypothetical protein
MPPINYDTATESERTGTTDPHTFTHTPSAINPPKGVVVTVAHGLSGTSFINSVSYGGVPLTLVSGASDTATEPGRASIWFKGSGLPTGPQTVNIDLTSATAEDIHFCCITLYTDDGRDIEVIDTDSITADIANPSRTLQYGGRTAIAIGSLYGGGSAPTAFTPNANCTTVAEFDLGAYYGEVIRQTTPGTADFTIGGTAAIDDVAFAVAAFAKVTTVSFNADPGSYAITGRAATLSPRPFRDDFNRADGGLGSNWVAVQGSFGITSNKIECTAGMRSAARWAVAADGDDQWAQLTIVDFGTFAGTIGVGVRMLTSGEYYEYVVYNGGRTLGRRSVVPDTVFQLGFSSTGVVAGDVIRLEVRGNKLRPLINGVLDPDIGEITDNNITGGGTAGIAGEVADATTGDNWSGGAFVGYSINAVSGSYTTTGAATTFARVSSISADPGNYALTGTAATFARGYFITAAPISYSITGAAVTTARSRSIDSISGTHTVTGTAATTARGYFITAAPGSYATAGFATALSRGNFITANPGAYAATGQAATTVRGRFIDAAPGAYSVAGLDAELSKTTAAEHVLAADSGAHSITGAVTALALGQFITADSASYTTEGQAATLAKTGVNQYEIAADSGSYALDGLTAALVFAQAGQFILTAAPGLYDLAAPASELLAVRQLILLPGSYAAAGLDTGGGIELYLLAQPGAYVLAGEEPIFELVRRFEPGIYLVSGTVAQLLFAPLQTVSDGWRFTNELLASSVLATSEISNPVFSNEAFGLVAMDGESIRQTGVHSEALQPVKLEVPLQTVGKFTDESLVSPDLVGIQSLTPIFGSEGFSFPDLDDESTGQPGADDETLEVTELEEEVLT